MSVQNRKMRLLAAPFLGVIAILVLWPLASVITDSFFAGGALSLANYRTILTDAFYLQSFATTTIISLISTGTGLVLGFLVAVALRARSGGTRRIVMAFANIGANFAGVPLAMALIFLFGLNGMFTLLLKELGLIDDFNVYSFTGLIIAYCYFQVALATLLITPALAAVGQDIEEAAALIGVGKLRFWLRVGLPTVVRQLLAIAILLFANAMSTFATTFALTGTSINVVTIRISELVSGDIFSDPNLANAIAICLLVVLLVPITASQILAGEKRR
ncbi:ABC transporter permease subunit [Agrobacterium tumefaciens]|uniref:ABC transporter permease n=1 Tax=Agrobacterium tumefaciens TaxID=358 RepID=UPI001571FCFA|nr:ABC transporter permease subunit [Agrobacterium tumefaciens]NTE56734.1 ABC transporter permease subunit [Agrobacterium tumefaciens]NTE71947.1 ABC transporter permease subunit [Agrobacterium tumefaciens]